MKKVRIVVTVLCIASMLLAAGLLFTGSKDKGEKGLVIGFDAFNVVAHISKKDPMTTTGLEKSFSPAGLMQ